MSDQLDLICTECPLSECDEGSLWCVLRLLQGDPNLAQAKYVKVLPVPRKKAFDRKTYGRRYRAENADKKREYDRQRYLQRKKNDEQTRIST